MKLRRLLQKLGSVKGLTNEEKGEISGQQSYKLLSNFYFSNLPDPEEFLHCLLSQTLRAEPFLKLSSGQEAYHHQLFVEKDDKLVMPTVQQLFEQSFLSSGIKLKEVTFFLTFDGSSQLFSFQFFALLGSTITHYSNASLREILQDVSSCTSVLAAGYNRFL